MISKLRFKLNLITLVSFRNYFKKYSNRIGMLDGVFRTICCGAVFSTGCGAIPSDESILYGNPSIALIEARDVGTPVNFNDLRIGLIFPDCFSCHSDFAKEEDLKRYFTPGNPQASPLFLAVESGRMPKTRAKLEDWKLNLLRDYILQQNPTETEIRLEPKYSSLKIHLFEKYCTRCHNPQLVGQNFYDFTTYNFVKAFSADIEDAAINDTRMPPAPNPAIPNEVKAVFKAWLLRGAPND